MSRFHWVLVLLLLGLAALVRLYQLGSVPNSLSWDEAAVAYNGWSIVQVHRDEWLDVVPISFKSFGDFKAPLAIYINGLSTAVFGSANWAVRLPYALAGIASVGLFSLLGFLLAKRGWWSGTSVVYGTLLFAIVPWHVHFSRIGFESGIALFFILLASVLIVLAMSNWLSGMVGSNSTKWHVGMIVLAAMSTAFSLYAYHSAKLFVPAAIILLLLVLRKKISIYHRFIMLYSAVLLLCSLPLIWDSVFGQGAERAGVLLSFSLAQPLAFPISVLKNIGAHLDQRYLLGGAVDTFRHGDGVFGILMPGMTTLIAVSLLPLIRRIFKKDHYFTPQIARAYTIAATWFAAGMAAGWLSEAAPHANRTLLALPGFIMLAILGWEYLSSRASQPGKRLADAARMLLGVCILVDVLWFAAYQYHYYHYYVRQSEDDFQAGYAQLFEYLDQLKQNGTLPGTVVLSREYGQPYIYALLYNKINPIAYHQGALNSFLFVDRISMTDLVRDDALVVGTIHDRLPVREAAVIESPTGSARFYVYRSEDK